MRGGKKDMIEIEQNSMDISVEQFLSTMFLKSHILMTDDPVEINLVQ
jgi:hypothetical protein